MREIARLAALLTLGAFLPLLPLVTAITYADEQVFAWRHYRRFAGGAERPGRQRPPLLGTPAAGASRP
jgi:hypothetical protein